jgi:FlaA1/EpsC-like NDP-sugar epimerase
MIRSAALARGGEVFVTKMPTLMIKDLLEVMIEVLAPRYGFEPKAIETQLLGSRPGEKLYEELLNEEETRRTLELEDHFVILPAFRYIYDRISYDYPGVVRSTVERVYRSEYETPMTRDQIRRFLLDHDLVNPAGAGTSGNRRQ